MYGKRKGYVVYEGPSMLDGAPIVGVVTLRTRNRKTGDMAQLWILSSNVDPVQASKTGQDSAVCGDCPHRWHTGGACYVNIGQAPLAVWRGYKREIYSRDWWQFRHDIEGRKIRLGAYGDPAALPYDILEKLCDMTKAHTGYTHQANHPMFDSRLANLVMISIDSPAQVTEARHFRVKHNDDELLHNEILCPAEDKGVQCVDCLLCKGGTKGKSIAINVHGTRAGNFDIIAVEAA